MRLHIVLATSLWLIGGDVCCAFQPTGLYSSRIGKTQMAAGKGFGKPSDNKPTTTTSSPKKSSPSSSQTSGGTGGLTSIESSSQMPSPADTAATPARGAEGAEKILMEQYGLRTIEDQLAEEKAKEQRNKISRLVQEAEKNEDFDIMTVIPAPLLLAIDTFLKAGLTLCTIVFVAAGVAITAEAYAAASKNPLPENIDSFIVNVVEPNFTPGLFVLLGFSITLGIFSALQLGSGSSQYKEE